MPSPMMISRKMVRFPKQKFPGRAKANPLCFKHLSKKPLSPYWVQAKSSKALCCSGVRLVS